MSNPIEIVSRGQAPYNVKSPMPNIKGAKSESRQLYSPTPRLSFQQALVIICDRSCYGESANWEIIDSTERVVFTSNDPSDRGILHKIDQVGIDSFVVVEP